LTFRRERENTPNYQLIITMTEVKKVDPNLTEKYSMAGFKNINGNIVQVGIGDVSVDEGQVSVETLPGSSKGGLTNTMKAVAAETHLPVKAVFNGKEITVNPKH
jgi:hypothetical protein